MAETPEFPVLLRSIDERAAAFRDAVAAAPHLDLRVPTCPDWTLSELARHLGEVHRFWAAVVDAGPAAGPPVAAENTEAAPRERDALVAWSAASTERLLDALRRAGPDRGCWTWWGASESPRTSGAVARHQVQEATVHTYDAQVTIGAPQPLPDVAALDGVDEFLFVCCGGLGAWPHEPAALDFHAAEGRSWRLSLSADGTRVSRLTSPDTAASASVRGTAAELVLALYGRIPMDSLRLDGDRRQFDLLLAWEPDEPAEPAGSAEPT